MTSPTHVRPGAGETGVAFRLRVGVTGHRDLDVDDALVGAIDGAIRRIVSTVPSAPRTPIAFEVVSSLSEGADRVVVERMLSLTDASLEVPLPLPVDVYERDFQTEGSRSEFRSLLGRAEIHRVVATTLERPIAYEEAGLSIVRGCDVLLAVWNGRRGRGPGGTDDVIETARGTGMWVVIVGSEAPHEVTEFNVPEAWPLISDLERFNGDLVGGDGGARGRRRALGGPGAIDAGPDVERSATEIETWIAPYIGPVDRVAERARRELLWTSRTMAALAVAAVAVVAVQVTFAPERHRLALLEVLCMITVLGLWGWLRGKDLHGRWVSMRFLAERLRAAGFLALVGIENFPGDRPAGLHAGGRQEWMTRAFREIWRLRPQVEPQPAAAPSLAHSLKDAWIDEQLHYYRTRGRYHANVRRVLLWTTGALFVCTVIAATLHAVVITEGTVSKLLIVVSIVFPALGGALSWLDVLEEHRSLADRYRSVADHLAPLSELADRVSDLESVRRLAAETDRELRSESAGWIDVMRYRDVDLLL